MSADRFVTASFNAPPLIALSLTSLTFNAVQGGPAPAPQTVNIANGGSGTLNGLTIGQIQYPPGQPTGWLAVTLNGTTAPTTITVSATPGILAPGTYTASVTVSAPTASNTPQTITVSFVIATPQAPVVTTRPATGVTTSSGTFVGDVAQDGKAYTIWFEWGTSPTLAAFNTLAPSAGPNTNCPGTVTCTWSFTQTGLTTGTTYYFRIVANNAVGTTRGAIVNFKTN
jgi:hypothetical protein